MEVCTRSTLVLSLLFAATIFTRIESVQAASGPTKGGAPACSGRNLVGAFASSEGYAGGGIVTFAVVNVGPTACRIGGYPKLLGIRKGHEYAFADVGHGTQDVSLRPAILAPRVSGALILDTPFGCNANVTPFPATDEYSGLVIVLPLGNGHVVVNGVHLYVPCGLGESQLGWAKEFAFN